jgi:DNA gyrase/topoisomerase IV subunit B
MKDDMINLVNKRCKKCNLKQPYFNYKNEKHGLYCNDCKKPDMINVFSEKKKCKKCKLFYVKKNTNYLCSYCNPEKTKRVKTKENEVKELLTQNNIQFIHDKQISNKCCYKYRPDFIIDCLYYYLIIEVDEDGHSNYDKECELIRMNNIQLSLELPTKFIRYNPDKKGIKKNIKQMELLDKVKEWMKKELDELETEEPVYLFY